MLYSLHLIYFNFKQSFLSSQFNKLKLSVSDPILKGFIFDSQLLSYLLHIFSIHCVVIHNLDTLLLFVLH